MKYSKLLLAAGLVMALVVLMVSPAAAGGPSTLSTHSVNITSIECSTGQVTVSIAHSASVYDVKHTVAFANSSTGVSSTPHSVVTHSAGVGTATESLSVNLGAINAGNTITVTSTFAGCCGGIDGAASAIVTITTTARCDDGRLNWHVWSTAVIYCSDEGGITVYQANKEGKIGQVFNVTAAELAALPAKPASNTLIKKVGNVSLYKLVTGEYQLNVGPDSEGKTQVLIWRNCNRNSLYQYELQASSHAPYARMGGWQTL